jgi:N-acetylglucosaminyl-diphospho-decaprenol L-rhamnosyltransferase
MTSEQRERPARLEPEVAARPAELSVVIVTYRNRSEIAECLRAVEQAVSPVPMEVIVVDNASGDGTAAAARAAMPGARVVERTVNDGFAGGCRVGAAVAAGQWLLFLNPDAMIAPQAIEALLGCASRYPRAGIIGGRFVHADGSVDPRSWWGRPSPWSALCFALGFTSLLHGSAVFDPESPRPWAADPHQARVVPVVTGALMLVRRELWDNLGGFDPMFFMYGEDADFCLRAAAQGWRPMVTANAVCVHEGGKSSTSIGKLILLFTGKVTLIRRHFPAGLRAVGVGLLLFGVAFRAMGSRLMNSVSPARQGRPTTRGEDWRALWTARDQWRRGWPGAVPPTAS